MALIDLAYIKTHLGISDDSEDAALTQWIAAVGAILQNDLAYPVEQTSVVEYLSGDGGVLLFLKNRNVTEITEIRLDPSGWFDQASGFGSTTVLTAGVDYALVLDDDDVSWSGMVRRINGVWPAEVGKGSGDLVPVRIPARGNVKVSYVCGFATIPEDLKYAAAVMTSMMRRVGKAGGPVSGFSFEGFSKSFGEADPTGVTSINSILSSYRKWIV